MQTMLGVIGGSGVYQIDGLEGASWVRVKTPWGKPSDEVLVGRLNGLPIAFLPRHGGDPRRYIPPHRIDHPANFAALKSLGVREVIGINSTGSLKQALPPGVLVVPDDFIMLHPGPSVHSTPAAHVTPDLSGEVRRKWLAAAADCGIAAVDGGVYWQTAGPRFETKAEIRLMSRAAEIGRAHV